MKADAQIKLSTLRRFWINQKLNVESNATLQIYNLVMLVGVFLNVVQMLRFQTHNLKNEIEKEIKKVVKR